MTGSGASAGQQPLQEDAGFTSLRLKLLGVILLVSALFTILATAAQLYFEYQTDLELLDSRINDIRKSHLPAIELSIWTVDTNLIQTQLNSLQSLPDVYAVHLATRYGDVFEVGPAIEGEDLKHYTIDLFNADARSYELGTLVIFTDLNVLYQRLVDRGIVILATLGVRTLFVSLCILFIVQFMLTRHLTRLARYVDNLSIENLQQGFELNRREHRRDELDAITDALNKMRVTLREEVVLLESARRDLAESEEKYRLAINATRDGLWDWNIPNGTIEYSPGWAYILGETSVENLYDTWESRIHPDDREDVISSLGELLAGGDSFWEKEHRLRNAEGEWIWVLGRGKVVTRDAEGRPLRMIGTMSNIQARKLSEEAHRDAEERISLLLNSTAEAIYGIDPAGVCTFVNPACVRMLGYAYQDELIGQNMHELMHHSRENGQPMPVAECRINRALFQGTGVHAENEVFWRKDGSCFPVEYWSYPMIKDGKVAGAVVTFIDITERLNDKRVLEHLATHDPLTGLGNRKVFDLRVEEEITRARRYARELSMIMIDIDHFKQINDEYGHPAGDQVLREFADILLGSVRQNDFVSRYGGEEFIILLPETAQQDAVEFAERLREKIAQMKIAIDDRKILNITASFGVACYPPDAESVEHLLKVADYAMYQAKKGGRNQVRTAI